MKSTARKYVIILCLIIAYPSSSARADFWGGDLPLLMQIVSNTLQQLVKMREILKTSNDTLGLLRDVNRGINDAMAIMRTLNTTFRPGILSDVKNPAELLALIQRLYGLIPKTAQAELEHLHDQTVAESITLHNQAFSYADAVDPEAERIKDYSRVVSPAGASKLTAESMGVLIHVSNQILRTNAAMLKVLSENLAMNNRQGKMESAQFKAQYEGLSRALGSSSSFGNALKLPK